MIPINEPRKSPPIAIFNLGFRPFFLLGALSAPFLIGYWLMLYSQGGSVGYYGNSLYWHAHEMLLGFTLAIIAGFLLTAVRNWTSVQTPYGLPLAVLTLLWILARVLPFVPDLSPWVIALVDLAFAPSVALAIGLPILRARNYRNLLFVPILLAFFAANLLVHLEVLQVTTATALTGLHLALYLAITVITVIGGRVIPFFTERGVSGVTCHRYSWVEKIIIPATLIWLVTTLINPEFVAPAASATMAILTLVRCYGWFDTRIVQVPLVWILQVGYLFIPLGFILTALASLGMISSSVALHSFAVGGIGLLTLGMMARVSLGHTGRPLQVTPMITAAFVLMTLSALIRVSISYLPLPYLAGLHLSGTLWAIAWLLFLIRYVPILLRPRVDGLFG